MSKRKTTKTKTETKTFIPTATVKITIPKPITWSADELVLVDKKLAGRIGTEMSFVTMLSVFLFQYRGPMAVIQPCQRFKEAVAGVAVGETAEVLASDHETVKLLIEQQNFIYDVGVKLIPHLEAITSV